jgi:ankyrin repeat protein
LWNILISVASNPKAGEIICVLDALDECLEVDRKQLTEALTMFYSENFKTQNLKFLLTSRPYDHIRRGFQGLENKVPTIHLSGEGEAEIQQISYEIDLVIKKRVEDISKQNDLRPDECSYLQEQLTSVPNRTYLWVSLTLNVVENMTGFTRGNIRQTIQSLPPNVDEAYGRILDRSPDQVKARRLLHVITAAERPLSLRELSLAMAFSAGYQSISDIRDELETDDKRLKRTIRDLCGLLVVIIDEKVYLLHQTAKEFLVQGSRSTSASANNLSQTNSWKHSLRPEESHEILANACMSYLIQDTTIQTDVFHYFLDYAAYYWPTHFRRAFTQDAHEAAKLGYRLCQTGSNIFRIWSNVFETRTWLPVSSSTILIASYLDLAAIVRLCLDTETADVDSKDSQYNQTPLSWAAEKGHEGVVALLLDTGNVDVNSRDTIRFTPLLWAARGGYEAIVRLLLDTGKVDVNSEDKNAQSPLSWAAGEGHEAVVRLLLDTGEVDIDSRSKLGATPLIWAAGEGHEAVVKLLLDTGKVDINSKDRWGRTALLWAAENGHEGVVALLLETGKVDLDSRTNSGETPLSLAMKEEHKAVVSLLEKSKIASTTTHIPVT